MLDWWIYHCDDECVSVANDAPCERIAIEYFSNSTGKFTLCQPTISEGNCITDLNNCLSAQATDGFLLIKQCNYSVKNSNLPLHTQCNSKNNWLEGCDILIVLLSQTVVYSNTTNSSEYNIVYVAHQEYIILLGTVIYVECLLIFLHTYFRLRKVKL